MALSNWDTLAFGPDSKPGPGVATNDLGNTIEIYKNWLHILAPKMWREGQTFIEPVIANMNHGDITLAGFQVWASRGRQNAVFVIVAPSNYPSDNVLMGGIGCYGYRGDKFVGAEPTTLEQFFKWAGKILEYECLDKGLEWLEKCKAETPIRCNQGDKFFSEKLGIDNQATKIGEAKPTILGEVLKSSLPEK